jgi:isoamylase
VFRRRRFLTGPAAADLRWFTVSGTEMTNLNWADPMARSVAVWIDGSTDPGVNTDGTPLPLTFTLPAERALPAHNSTSDRAR